MSQFFAKIYAATVQGKLEWELTANPKVLTAPLGDDYFVRVALVPDLDDEGPEPDQIVYLFQGQTQLLKVTRKNISVDSIRQWLNTDETYPYRLFEDLWMRAQARATKLDLHLNAVNRLLDERISDKG